MVTRFLFIFIAVLLSSKAIIAQTDKPRFGIGVENQFLFAGESNASFDFLIGARAYYFLQPKKMIQPFVRAGFATDVGIQNARLISTDVQVGAFWNFSRRFSLVASVGGDFTAESHSFLLDGKRTNWNDSNLGITGSLGLNYRISKTLSSILSIKQTNLNATSIGLGLNYSF